MKATTLYDIAIIGGGPAGSTFATYARKKGFNVVLFEKEKFPRDHVGESLIPFTYWKLKDLNVFEDLKPFITYKPGVNFVDTDGVKESTWCFEKVLDNESKISFHTLRAPFDKVLLDNSKRNGAVVLEETKVKSVDLNNPKEVTINVESAEGNAETFKARFLVDASGQDSFLAKKLGDKKAFKDLDRVAVFCHWENVKYDKALNQGLIKIIYLGGEKKGWIWVIPVGRNHLSIGVTLNNAYVKQMKSKFENENSTDWIKDLYLQELGYAKALDGILEGAHMEHKILTLGDYSYYVEKKYGPNYLMIGDAGAFLDPIFSSGIYVAMETAERTLSGVEKTLKEGYKDVKKEFENAFVTIDGAYRLIEKFVRLFYSLDVLNFSHVDTKNPVTYEKFLYAYNIFHYLLAGDFFDQHQKYSDFIDTINYEKSYKRFVSYVQEKKNETNLDQDCGYSFEDIYGHIPANLSKVATVTG